MTGLIIDSFAGGGGASTGMKLGSLFDGSGGFPLAGVLHGVEPVWGNGLALPNAAHVVGCAVKLIKETQE